MMPQVWEKGEDEEQQEDKAVGVRDSVWHSAIGTISTIGVRDNYSPVIRSSQDGVASCLLAAAIRVAVICTLISRATYLGTRTSTPTHKRR